MHQGDSTAMKICRVLPAITGLVLGCAFSAALARSQARPQTAPLGQIVKSSGGYIGEAAATDGSTIYSGDYLSTLDDGSMLVRLGALTLELEASSGAHVYRTPYGAIAELNRGTIIYRTPGTQENLVIVASDIRVTPALSTPDFGRVTLNDTCNVTVYSQRGRANVQAGSEWKFVEEGKAYRVRALDAISYRDYLSPDADGYHRHHEHAPCAPLLLAKGHPPIAGGQSHFQIVAAGFITFATLWAVHEAFESPSRP
jgi:hypothetical protein